MSKMRVAIIIESLKIKGGGERQAIMLVKTLQAFGEEVTLYTTKVDRALCYPEHLADLKIVELGETDPPAAFKMPFLEALTRRKRKWRLARALSRLISPDTEILNPHELFAAEVAYYFKKNHPYIPCVLMLNDVYTASWSLLDDPLFDSPRRTFLARVRAVFLDILDLRFLKAVDQILVLNERSVHFAKRYLYRPALVIRSAVDVSQFEYRPRAPLSPRGQLRLLANGIFYLHRRYEDTIKALGILRDQGYQARLKIIGEWRHKDSAKAYHQKLLALARALGLESNVTFSGVVTEEELLVAYYESDILVAATHMQTWGLATFEALSTGLPVIISKTAGAAEVLEEGKHVLYCDPGAPESIVVAVERLVREPDLYRRISFEAQKYIRENFTWERYANEMRAIFQNYLH